MTRTTLHTVHPQLALQKKTHKNVVMRVSRANSYKRSVTQRGLRLCRTARWVFWEPHVVVHVCYRLWAVVTGHRA
jgi:hypothetical protein